MALHAGGGSSGGGGGGGETAFTAAGTGAQSRTKQNKMRDIVSFLDFVPEAKHAAILDYTSTDDMLSYFDAVHDKFSANGSSLGGQVWFPAGKYKFSGPLDIEKRLILEGAGAGDQPSQAPTIFEFTADTNGMRFHSTLTSPNGSSSDGSIVRGIQLRCTASSPTTGKGIYATTKVVVEDCIIRTFGSHGIEIYGHPGTIGIADFWNVTRTTIYQCGGDGMYIHGDDAQIGTALQVEAKECGGWGFNDNSPYFSTYISCHTAGNVTGSYRRPATMSYMGGIYIGCYTEGGTGQNSSLHKGCLVIGGNMDASTGTFLHNGAEGSGIDVPASSEWAFSRAGVLAWKVTSDNEMTGIAQYSPGSLGTYLNDRKVNLVAATTDEATVASLRNGNGEVGSVRTNGTSAVFVPGPSGNTYLSDNRLNINRTADGTFCLFKSSGSDAGSIDLSSGALQIFCTSSGGSGTYYTSTDFKVARAGDATVGRFVRAGSDVGSISISTGATAYNTSSDYRLKSNVKPMQGALARIMALKPVTYDWKAGGTGEGFIAHEAQAVFPLAVTGEKDGEEMQQIDPSKMIGALVAAVQELSAKVDRLAA